MKILEEAGFAVHMVGGGGMGMSHQTDSHTYVLDAGGEHIKLLDKKMSGRWTDVTATRVPFFPDVVAGARAGAVR